MKNIIDKLRIPKQKCFKFLLCFISSVVIFLSVFASVIFVSAEENVPISWGTGKAFINTAPYFNVTDTFVINDNIVLKYKVLYKYTAWDSVSDKSEYYGALFSDSPIATISKSAPTSDGHIYYYFTGGSVGGSVDCSYRVSDGVRSGSIGYDVKDFSIIYTNCTSVIGADGNNMSIPLSKSDFNVTFTPNNTTKAYDINITTARTEPYYLSVNGFNKNADGSKGSAMFSYADFLNEESQGSEVTLTINEISDYLRYGSKPSSFSGVSDIDFQTLFFKQLYICMRTYDDNFARTELPDVLSGNDAVKTFLAQYSLWHKYGCKSSYLKSKFNDDFSKNSFFKMTIQNQVSANYRVYEKQFIGNQSFSIPYTYFKTTLNADYIFTVLITDKGSKAQDSQFFWWDFDFKGLGYDGSANPVKNPDYIHTPNSPDGVPNGPPNVTNTPPDNDDYGKYTDNGFDTKSFTGSTNSIFDWFKGFLFIFPPEVTAIISLGLVVIVGIGIIRLVVG